MIETPMFIISNAAGKSLVRGMETVEILIDGSEFIPSTIQFEYSE